MSMSDYFRPFVWWYFHELPRGSDWGGGDAVNNVLENITVMRLQKIHVSFNEPPWKLTHNLVHSWRRPLNSSTKLERFTRIWGAKFTRRFSRNSEIDFIWRHYSVHGKNQLWRMMTILLWLQRWLWTQLYNIDVCAATVVNQEFVRVMYPKLCEDPGDGSRLSNGDTLFCM